MDFDPNILKELIKTFSSEFDELVAELNEHLLKLEKAADGKEKDDVINVLFRASHTIKGGARSVNIEDLGTLAHRLEDLFGELRQGKIKVSAALIDQCLASTDAMKSIMESFLNEKAMTVDLDHELAQLSHIIEGDEIEVESHAEKSDEPVEVQIKPSKPTAEKEANFIKVDMKRLTDVNAISDELQGVKLEVDYCDRLVGVLTNKIEQLNKKWRLSQALLKRIAGDDQHVELKNLVVSSLDDVAVIDDVSRQMKSNIHKANAEFNHLSNMLQDNIRMLRLVPIATILHPLNRSIRDITKELNKQVDVDIQGEQIQVDRSVLSVAKECLLHLLRNAIDHGIESSEQRKEAGKAEQGHITISASQEGDNVIIEVKDDGGGIDKEAISAIAIEKKLFSSSEINSMSESDIINLIFHPGFSTRKIITDLSGRGVGLDVVHSNLQSIKGQVSVETRVGEGSTFRMELPLTLVSDRGMLLRCASQLFAIPTNAVVRVLSISRDDIIDVEAGQAILFHNKPIALRDLSVVIGRPGHEINPHTDLSVVVISKGWHSVALIVDEVIGEHEIVIKQLKAPLQSVPNIAGATLTGRGEVIVVFNALELVDTALQSNPRAFASAQSAQDEIAKTPAKILVVDDSITTRTLETNILEINGYSVVPCVDGREAWERIQTEKFDLIITDIEMPKMDGFELTDLIKQSEANKHIPVIIVTSLSKDKDKARGIEVGADAYIVKNAFDTTSLLQTVESLL